MHRVNPTTNYLKIGQVAATCGIGVETIRFYEQKGLIPTPPRSSAGYRLYPLETAARINFILRSKELGFSLRETGEFLTLKAADGPDCHEVHAQVLEKIKWIEEKITELEKIKTSLAKLTEHCDGSDPISTCPILHHLAICDDTGCCHE